MQDIEKIAKYLKKAKEDDSLDYADIIRKYPDTISFGVDVTYIYGKSRPQTIKYRELHDIPKGIYRFNAHVPKDQHKNFINKIEKLTQYGIKVTYNSDETDVFGYAEKG